MMNIKMIKLILVILYLIIILGKNDDELLR